MLVRAGSGAARWSSLALIALAEPRLQLELVDILAATRIYYREEDSNLSARPLGTARGVWAFLDWFTRGNSRNKPDVKTGLAAALAAAMMAETNTPMEALAA